MGNEVTGMWVKASARHAAETPRADSNTAASAEPLQDPILPRIDPPHANPFHLNPETVRATYQSVIASKYKLIQELQQVIARRIGVQESIRAKVDSLDAEIEALEQKRSGANLRANKTREMLISRGETAEQVQQNDLYRKCLTASNEFALTTGERQRRVQELQADFQTVASQISNEKNKIRRLRREIDSLELERDATISDIVTASEQAEINEIVSQVLQGEQQNQLAKVRDVRQRARVRARVSTELADATMTDEFDFLEFAHAGITTTSPMTPHSRRNAARHESQRTGDRLRQWFKSPTVVRSLLASCGLLIGIACLPTPHSGGDHAPAAPQATTEPPVADALIDADLPCVTALLRVPAAR